LPIHLLYNISMSLLENIFRKKSTREYWDRVYSKNSPEEVTWYQKFPSTSLELIELAGVSHGERIIDIGGGASTLVDCLVAMGHSGMEVLDISGNALLGAQRRLGVNAARVRWIEADVTEYQFEKDACDLWHDRAVFHFLTEPQKRDAYREALTRSLKTGGHIVISTFGLDGPQKCSGLRVARYDAAGLSREMGPGFTLVESRSEIHTAPSGHRQSFIFCLFRKDGE